MCWSPAHTEDKVDNGRTAWISLGPSRVVAVSPSGSVIQLTICVMIWEILLMNRNDNDGERKEILCNFLCLYSPLTKAMSSTIKMEDLSGDTLSNIISDFSHFLPSVSLTLTWWAIPFSHDWKVERPRRVWWFTGLISLESATCIQLTQQTSEKRRDQRSISFLSPYSINLGKSK